MRLPHGSRKSLPRTSASASSTSPTSSATWFIPTSRAKLSGPVSLTLCPPALRHRRRARARLPRKSCAAELPFPVHDQGNPTAVPGNPGRLVVVASDHHVEMEPRAVEAARPGLGWTRLVVGGAEGDVSGGVLVE